MTADLALVLDTAMHAARLGGQLALSRLGDPGFQKWKGPRDLLAGAALDIQARIVELIREVFPDHHFLVEESEEPQDETADPLWVIDPVDGSLNFFHGIPFFAVSIAYREAGVYKVGVVYDPNRDELFHAIDGGSAYLNGEPIQVDQFSEGWEAFSGAMVGTDWSGDMPAVRRAFQVSRFLAPQILHMRVLGAPALGVCYVAAGRLHAYFGLENLKVWDVAAGAIILKAAGGIITNIHGASWLYGEDGYLATNNVIHGSVGRSMQPILELQRQRQEAENADT